MRAEPDPLRDPLGELLALRGHLVLDGAMATELERHGADLNHPLWSARLLREDPEAIIRVHRSYLEVGADILTTASYQLSAEGLAACGDDPNQLGELLHISVALARESCRRHREATGDDRRRLIALSLGPRSAAVPGGAEYGDQSRWSATDLHEWHRGRTALAAKVGADLLAIETIPSLREGRVLAAQLEEHSGVSAWISFACRDDRTTTGGDSFAEAVRAVAGSDRVVGVGVNCTPPEYVEALIGVARQVTGKPILVYPNSGEVYGADRRWSGVGGGEWATLAKRWRQAGAQVIGGCCRTDPDILRSVLP